MLDEVAARQWGQPGGVAIGDAALVKALVKEGKDAIDPLLRCLAEDARLTRSVQFGRSFHRGRTIIGVYSAAYAALGGILRSGQFGEGTSHYDLTTGGMAGRRAIAAKIRAYWEKHRDLSVWERRYRILADDDATPKQWLEAAKGIVRPVDVEVTFGSGWVTVPRRKPGEIPKLGGESLRDKRRPTVAELMAKRVDFLSDHGAPGTRRDFAMRKACDLALILARWDVVAARPVLRVQMNRCRERMTGHGEKVSTAIERFASYIGNFTLERVRGGDESALAEYAEWIRTMSPRSIKSFRFDELKPLWRHPDHPATAEAAEWLFNDDKSPWTPLLRSREDGGSYRPGRLLVTPLVGSAGFRMYLQKELADRSPAGSATLVEKGRLKVSFDGAWTNSAPRWGGDPLAPELGTEVAFRRCDLFAWELSKLDGTPMCELYWPEAARDEAVAACAAFLTSHGDRFRYNKAHRELGRGMRTEKARMTFARLDRPATTDAVRRALAIFSLEDEGETLENA
jgi:hypothetical protein